jgi:hypothetical protein
MIPTNKPIINRTIFCLCLISAWALPSVFLYAFLAPNGMAWWWNGIGIICALIMYLLAFILTFTIGGLRYVLTGREDTI